MPTQQSMIHGKYHDNTSYLLGNVDVGTQEFAGMGNCVGNRQMTRTDKSQMMMSHWVAQTNRTKESHKTR